MTHLLLIIIYLAFISLGLPDSLLGSAWPSMHVEFGVPFSYAGSISMIIAAGTIIASLLSDRLTKRLGAGRVTAISVGMTAAALFGFSLSHSYWALLLWAVPYGLGAGSVDAALNNYVALHYASRHMSWLHCMWGVGASVGPVIMGLAIAGGLGWNGGYSAIGWMQIALTAVLVLSLPLWKAPSDAAPAADSQHEDAAPAADLQHADATSVTDPADRRVLSLAEIASIPGAKAVMVTFFCYCALEQTAGLWASTFLVLKWGVSAEQAASLASLFFIGITAGRAVSGFATFRFSDRQMVRIGQGIVLLGVILLLLPAGQTAAMAGFVTVGVGCAPIYPSLIHATPDHFGRDRSQALIGVQMASAYLGICVMPPLFGVLARAITISLLPFYLLALLLLMFAMHERLIAAAGAE